MKKIFLLFSLLIVTYISNAQSGASCATAKDFSTATAAPPFESQTQQVQWYKFVAKSNEVKITLLNRNFTSFRANK
ncbi:MAG: hypothetical protein ACT4ON_11500, partial [Bacteroidota bacterium]